MRIRLLVDIQGFSVRSDGSSFDWPSRGGEVEVDDATAQDMIHSQQAIPVTTLQHGEDTSAKEDDVEFRQVEAVPEEGAEDDADEEAQGRAAAEAGEERSNPYDGRTAKGKAWYRGYDSAS